MSRDVSTVPHALALRRLVHPTRAVPVIAVVVPCYRAQQHVLEVLARIGPECERIYVVDDACPDGTGHHVSAHCTDPRVHVLFHQSNQGVGGAVVTGYRAALADGATIIVKIDADGQMDPALIPGFVAPIVEGVADYTKGNRFWNPDDARAMPALRLVGNAALSFMTKFSTGYWSIFDPTNGYTAIHAEVARRLPLERIARRYFFESDILFWLGIGRARVVDVPMTAVYGDETSSLVVREVLPEFLRKHGGNFARRIAYTYFLRDFSIASLELLVGALFLTFGTVFGAFAWYRSIASGVVATTGTVMLSVLPIIVGVQLLLSFIGYDVANSPAMALHPMLGPPSPDPPPER